MEKEELGLSFDNIMDDNEISSILFSELSDDDDTTIPPDKGNPDEGGKEKKEDTAEVDPDDIFGDETPESVGSEENNKGDKEETALQKGGASPNDFFSSIATAFAEEGLFPDLDEETISKIKTAQDLRDAVKQQMKNELDEVQRRVAEALDNGVEPDQIRQYENIIGWLNAQDKNIDVEGDAGDDLRRRIIMQDYINKGFKEDKAKSMVEKIFEEGNDKKEANESLQNLKDSYGKDYQKLLDDAKHEAEAEAEERKQKAARIKTSILEGKLDFFGDIEISKEVRQKAYDAISRPVYKDPKTGNTYTAVQKLELDNSEEFMAKLGLIYALTNGMTSIEGLVKKKAAKEVKRGFSELERKINSTARNSQGNLNFASGVSDENSFIGKGMKLDI